MAESDGIKVVKTKPAAYLTTAEFAEQVGHVPQTVNYAYRRGRFLKTKLLWWEREGVPLTLLIHRSQVKTYLASCRTTKPGPQKTAPKLKKPVKAPTPTPTPETFSIENVDLETTDDIGLVKLIKEKIETKRRSLELQMAENTLVEWEEVAKLWEAAAIQVRQSILAVVPRLAARLAAENDVHQCSEMLKRELMEALIELSKQEFADDYGSSN